MKRQYDFRKSRPSPYASLLKKPVTIRLDQDSIAYFKAMAQELGVPYQSLINLYLRDCALSKRRLRLDWK
jgi:uncharacterized protein (DUF4415 family)